jgi:hypothetical protein
VVRLLGSFVGRGARSCYIKLDPIRSGYSKVPVIFGNSADNRPTPTAASAQNRQGQTGSTLSVSGLYVVFEIEVV